MKLRKLIKKGCACCVAAGLALSLTGCVFISSPEDLYKLPKLPDEYVDLEGELATLVSNGYEYAAPTGGENIQLVQMVDLNGDGVDEAIAFLRKAGDEKPLKICIFALKDGGYQSAAVIEESAASISRVDYRDMNGDGSLELVVGWQIMNKDASKPLENDAITDRALFRVVSVYDLRNFSCSKELETNYHRYRITDLDENGTPELMVLVGDAASTSSAVAYEWTAGAMEQVYTARLSMPPAQMEDVREGLLNDGVDALFVTGSVDEKTLVTDILVVEKGSLVNCVQDEQTGMSGLVYRNAALPARDLYSNGILELPLSYELDRVSENDKTYWGINWTTFSSKGKAKVAETTYHNMTDGWYLVLPESWKNQLVITNVSSITGERAVTFGILEGKDRTARDLLTIYTETGDSREYKANKGTRFVLLRQSTTIYAAEFLEGYRDWEGAMTEDALKGAFHVIRAEWNLD